MTNRDVETKIEIKIHNNEMYINVQGGRHAIGFLLGKAIQAIGGEHTTELLSDIALSALFMQSKKNYKKSEKK